MPGAPNTKTEYKDWRDKTKWECDAKIRKQYRSYQQGKEDVRYRRKHDMGDGRIE